MDDCKRDGLEAPPTSLFCLLPATLRTLSHAFLPAQGDVFGVLQELARVDPSTVGAQLPAVLAGVTTALAVSPTDVERAAGLGSGGIPAHAHRLPVTV